MYGQLFHPHVLMFTYIYIYRYIYVHIYIYIYVCIVLEHAEAQEILRQERPGGSFVELASFNRLLGLCSHLRSAGSSESSLVSTVSKHYMGLGFRV